jgi:hypothetical protein
MRMPRRTHRGWPEHYPTLYTREARQGIIQLIDTRSYSGWVFHVLYTLVHFKCLFIQTQQTQALIDTGGGYHLRAPNLRSRPLSPFPSSILYFPLIAPPGLQLCQPFDHPAKPHRTSIDRKGSIASGFQPLVFYR